jgi:hypothetical protein
MSGVIPPLPQYAFMALCLVKHRDNFTFTLYGIMRKCHSTGNNLLLYHFIKRMIRLTVVIIEKPPFYQLPTKFYQTFFWPG